MTLPHRIEAAEGADRARTLESLTRIEHANRILDGKQYLDPYEPCPCCEMWTHDECLNGKGCPYLDGRNGDAIRKNAALRAKESSDGE